MADWLRLTVELKGCEPIDCRVELKPTDGPINQSYAIVGLAGVLARRMLELIESFGYGRKE